MFLTQSDNSSDSAQIHRILSTHTKILDKLVLPPFLAQPQSLEHAIASIDNIPPALHQSPTALAYLHNLRTEQNSLASIKREIQDEFEELRTRAERGAGYDAKEYMAFCRSMLNVVLYTYGILGMKEVEELKEIRTVKTWLNGSDAEVRVVMDVVADMVEDLDLLEL
jgi:hypothetical protein